MITSWHLGLQELATYLYTSEQINSMKVYFSYAVLLFVCTKVQNTQDAVLKNIMLSLQYW